MYGLDQQFEEGNGVSLTAKLSKERHNEVSVTGKLHR